MFCIQYHKKIFWLPWNILSLQSWTTVSYSQCIMPKFRYSFTFYCLLIAVISIFTVKNFPCNTLWVCVCARKWWNQRKAFSDRKKVQQQNRSRRCGILVAPPQSHPPTQWVHCHRSVWGWMPPYVNVFWSFSIPWSNTYACVSLCLCVFVCGRTLM